MGYRSVLRSVNSTINQMERNAIRKQKELERQRKAYEKMQALEQAAYEYEVFENYLERITTLQKDCGPKIDWNNIPKDPCPDEPAEYHENENNARKILENYKPNVFAKILKTENKKRDKYKSDVEIAIKKDKEIYNEQYEKYKNDKEEYDNLLELSKNVLNGNLKYYEKAIEDIAPFQEITDIGTGIEINYIDPKKCKVILDIHNDEVIPKQSKSLLKSGKLSIKDMPIGKYNDYYQDYVCSAVLRVGREIFSILPIDEIIVTAKANVLDTSTGRIVPKPLLSVLLVRETMEMLDFELLDASDSMKNFIHNMVYKKAQGLSPVEEVEFPNI